MGDLACAPFGVPCHLLAPSTVRPHWGGASVLHHRLTCPFYSSTTGGQEPNTLVLALCTLHRWIYLHLQWMGGSQAKRWGCDHQWCEVGNSGTLRSTMMAPNDAKKRVARHYLFLRIKRTTVNGVLLKPTKPNNVKTNPNRTRKSTLWLGKGGCTL